MMGERDDSEECLETINGSLPEWAEILEPIRHLPTNNGSRIKKRVHESLEKGPPEWATKRLHFSISTTLYKANAAGPTKKAICSVLDDVVGKHVNADSKGNKKKKKHHLLLPDITLKLCRIVLRHSASLFESFCKLFPRNLMDSPQRKLQSLVSVFDHLDFRTIDCRLAVGAYGGSHEAFFHDVQELWDNARTSRVWGPYMVQLADTFLQIFQLAYEKEVIDVVRKLNKYSESNIVSLEASKEVENTLKSVREMPKAPWNFGYCKVCSIDKDDDVVLLCDICDGEYHTYCLATPLGAIPKAAWYCPLCISPESVAHRAASHVSDLQARWKEEEEESETSADEYDACEVCGDRGSCDDLLRCSNCKISFVHRCCYLDSGQKSGEDIMWTCKECAEN